MDVPGSFLHTVEVGQDNPVLFPEPCGPTGARVPCREAREGVLVPEVGHRDVAASQLVALTLLLDDVLHELGHLEPLTGDKGLLQPLQAAVDGGLQFRPLLG